MAHFKRLLTLLTTTNSSEAPRRSCICLLPNASLYDTFTYFVQLLYFYVLHVDGIDNEYLNINCNEDRC